MNFLKVFSLEMRETIKVLQHQFNFEIKHETWNSVVASS